MWALVRAFARNTSGAAAIEYAFIAMLVAIALVSALTTIGTNLRKPYNDVANGLK